MMYSLIFMLSITSGQQMVNGVPYKIIEPKYYKNRSTQNIKYKGALIEVPTFDEQIPMYWEIKEPNGQVKEVHFLYKSFLRRPSQVGKVAVQFNFNSR